MLIASRVTSGNLSADVVISTEPITVYGIVVANSALSAAEVTFVDSNGVVKHVVTVPAEDSKQWTVPFIAEGLTAQSIGASTVFVTVYHTAEGS